jgi:hypothetical protein
MSSFVEGEAPYPDWATYEIPPDFERLTGGERLFELCKFKFAEYAPHIEELSNGLAEEPQLRLMLWTVLEGEVANRYTREFDIKRWSNAERFDVAIYTSGTAHASGLPAKQQVTLGVGEPPPEIDSKICDDLYAAAAYPGPPFSPSAISDVWMRRAAFRAGRLSDNS